MNDEILLKGLINGDENAYKHLYNLYYEDLVVYCYNLTNDWAKAEDVVQNTLIKMWCKRENISINSSLKSYLYRSVYNGFATLYKQEKRKQESLHEIKEKTLESMIEMNDEDVESKMRLVQDAIEKLPKKCKAVFLLNKVEGYKYKEVAEQLNLSEKTVEKHISRAIQRIKEFIKTNDNLILLLLSKF